MSDEDLYYGRLQLRMAGATLAAAVIVFLIYF